jgi:hypothetical protein
MTVLSQPEPVVRVLTMLAKMLPPVGREPRLLWLPSRVFNGLY